jgi:hypothetical protein
VDGAKEMARSEAEVFLDALNWGGRGGEGPPGDTASYMALLRERLAAARTDALASRVELERARRRIAQQQGQVGILEGLLNQAYASRGWQLANWLQGRLSALRGLFAGGPRAAEREGRCDGGPPDSQGSDDPTRPRGPAVLPG